ncbi:MAG: nicotinate-nucleotide adenylyltransferase [Clostridiales bacterium]|nr:nicotinate-nucleotide adenylyltransferase [Clostridiales bacterium]
MRFTEKIGILGGTFQPVHTAHIQMAQSALARLGLDRVLLVPANIPPHKQLPGGASAADRWRMVCLAAEGMPELVPDDMELRREGPSYTADTLRILRERYPKAELFFLMGSDMLASFDSWHKPQDVATLATPVCIPRDGSDDSAAIAHIRSAYGVNVPELPPALPISSTEIRARVTAARPITGLVPPAVEDYIYERGLYQPEDIRAAMAQLRAVLDPLRFTHSIRVMRTAIDLAEKYGVNTEQTRWAALLHDCAKQLPPEEQKRLSGDETDISKIWHAAAGARLAETEYGVRDPAVLRAIALHTTGDQGMTDLDKIIYLADIIEPDRDFPAVQEIRQETSLNRAILLALGCAICYIQKADGQLHPATLRAYLDLGGNKEELETF